MSTMEMQRNEVAVDPSNAPVHWRQYSELRIKKNQVLAQDDRYPILLLVEGSILISKSSSSYDRSYNTLLRGPAILRMDLEGGSIPCKVSAILEPSTIIQISTNEVLEMIASDRRRFDYLMGLMFQQYRQMDECADDLITKKDAELRLLSFLDQEGREHGVRMGNSCFLKLPLSHRQMAEIIFACRQSVSTTLSQLRKLDLIAYDRKSVVIYRDRFDAYFRMKTREHLANQELNLDMPAPSKGVVRKLSPVLSPQHAKGYAVA